MKGRKTPPTAFITRLIYTTSRPDFTAMLARSPLTRAERELVTRYAEGALYKELAALYNVSEQTIYTRKRKAYEKLHAYLAQK